MHEWNEGQKAQQTHSLGLCLGYNSERKDVVFYLGDTLGYVFVGLSTRFDYKSEFSTIFIYHCMHHNHHLIHHHQNHFPMQCLY